MILRKKKQEIPRLTRTNERFSSIDFPSPQYLERLDAITKKHWNSQLLWTELWKHWNNVEIRVGGSQVVVTCDKDKRDFIKKMDDIVDSCLGGYSKWPEFHKITTTAQNLPDALALALLQTIGQRGTDGKK